jgi:RNA recognition motif-containing protein
MPSPTFAVGWYAYALVSRLVIATTEKSLSMGYGFVEFKKKDDAVKALKNMQNVTVSITPYHNEHDAVHFPIILLLMNRLMVTNCH